MTELKACKVCDISRHKYYGLAVNSLDQLKIKGSEALGFGSAASVSVVLEDDGTIVEDEDYFLCLPMNTKFILLLDRDAWAPAHACEPDTVDGGHSGAEPWYSLAEQLRHDLASIILMSEADLQSLIDVTCSDLASALGFSQQRTQILQDTLQRVLDRREEERQSKELLQLYLKALEQEGNRDSQGESTKQDETDGVQVDSVTEISSGTLMVLKTKTCPETRISNEELQMVVKQGVEVMMQELGWDSERTSVLVQACESELSKRLQQVQAVQNLRAQSKTSSSTSHPRADGATRAKRRK